MTDGVAQPLPSTDHAAPQGPRALGRFEWLVAFRYLLARRSQQGSVSVIPIFCIVGIAVGVATLIIVLSVMNGFRHDLLVRIIGVNGHAFVEKPSGPLRDYQAIAAKLETIAGVRLAIPTVDENAMFAAQGAQSGGAARGVREADLKRLPALTSSVKLGTLDGLDSSGGIAIGQRLANDLKVEVGDNVTLFSTRGAPAGAGLRPRSKAFPVQAIYLVGRSELDNQLVFMSLDAAQTFFERNNEVSGIEVFVRDPEHMTDVLARIRQELADKAVTVTDWRSRNALLVGALDTEHNVMFIIVSLIVVVAVFNIISGLVTLVTVKQHDIGVLRTIGATRGAVMRIFLLAGAAIGAIGTAFGLGLGLLISAGLSSVKTWIDSAYNKYELSHLVYFITHLPSVIDRSEVIVVCLMAFTMALLATLYPAWRAASLSPVDALRTA